MCPGKSFNILPSTEHITLMKPKAMKYGGMVLPEDMNIPMGVLPDENDPDRVLTRLMPGELVVPIKHTKKVVKFLKKEGIRLPRM
jgi:hypothetical protein